MILNKVGNVSNFSNEGNLNYIRAVIKKGKVRPWRTETLGKEIKSNISKKEKSQQLL